MLEKDVFLSPFTMFSLFPEAFTELHEEQRYVAESLNGYTDIEIRISPEGKIELISYVTNTGIIVHNDFYDWDCTTIDR